jgi:UDP-glucuronate decarboxylase
VQALRGQEITIYGEGTQTRSFCYVDDLIEALVRMMETPSDVTGPINIGNPQEFTIRELAELIIKLTGTKSKLRFEPLPSDDPRQRRPDISEAKSTLKWEPKTQLLEGLTKTIAYFENILRKEVLTPVHASNFCLFRPKP